MATTWIGDEDTLIPEDEIEYTLSEETTDGKLTALYYAPQYVNPQDSNDVLKGGEVKVTDATKLKAYTAAKADDPEGAHLVARPTFNLRGTHYRASSGKDSAAKDAADTVSYEGEKMAEECAKYSGAQHKACMDMVAARMEQMMKSKGYAKGGLVTQQRQDYVMRKQYAEGGAVMDDGMSLMDDPMMMMPPLQEEEFMAAEEDVESDNIVARLTAALSPEEQQVLDEALTMHPELIGILDKAEMIISEAASGEFVGEGEVDGPGTGTSDSIPARLSDGEFVFTAKAVKQLGVDKLRKMMAKAEQDYDSAMNVQETNQMEDGEFAMGGLLDKARKEWGSLDSAVAEYNQPMEMSKPVTVNGAGQQVKKDETGILTQRNVDLMSARQSEEAQRRAKNTGLMTAPEQQQQSSVNNTQEREDMQRMLSEEEKAKRAEGLLG